MRLREGMRYEERLGGNEQIAPCCIERAARSDCGNDYKRWGFGFSRCFNIADLPDRSTMNTLRHRLHDHAERYQIHSDTALSF